jgi:tetratricopeptide (TPR) repeat protein
MADFAGQASRAILALEEVPTRAGCVIMGAMEPERRGESTMRAAAPSRGWKAALIVRLVLAGAATLALGVTAVPGGLIAAVEDGHAAASTGDYERAAATYLTADSYSPGGAVFLGRAVQAELAAGAYQQAADHLALLQERRDLTGEELLWSGAIHAGLGQDEAALAAWERARALGAVTPEGLEALARSYLRAGDLDRAQVALDELSSLGVDDPALLERLALLQAFDRPEQAAATVERIAAQEPDRARELAPVIEAATARHSPSTGTRFARLGAALLDAGEVTLAEAAFTRAVDENPAYGEALAYLAYTRARLGQPALAASQEAAALTPDNPVVHYLAGLTWMELAEPAYAQGAFERSFALDPANPAVAVEIAGTYRLRGRLSAAELWMQEAVRLAGDDPRFRLLMAQFYVDEEYRVEEMGIPLAEALVDDVPGDAGAHEALGWGYFVGGRVDEALAELDRALVLDPAYPRAHLHMGMLLESQGRLSEAITHYERAVELDPEGPYGALARRALGRNESG